MAESQSDIDITTVQSDKVRSSSRERIMTDKGLEFKSSTCYQNFRTALSAWRRTAIAIELTLCESKDVHVLKDQCKVLVASMMDMNSAYEQLCELSSAENVDSELQKRFDLTEQEHHTLTKRIAKRIHTLESDRLETGTNTSNRSYKSNTSQRSNAAKRSDAAAEAAALKAKMKYFDAESKVKIELEKQNTELEKLECMKELEMAEAKAQAYEKEYTWSDDDDTKFELADTSKEYVQEFVAGISVSSTTIKPSVTNVTSHTTVPQMSAREFVPADVNPSVHYQTSNALPETRVTWSNLPTAKPALLHSQTSQVNPWDTTESTNSKTEQGLLELANSLADQVSLGRLPAPEPSVFTGDPLKYPGWKVSFQTLIVQRCIPPPERIYYLRKYLGGEVRETVENFFLMASEDAYEEAQKLIDQRYGSPFVIASAFRDKLEKWPKINPRDGAGL
jgi:hypothetical protein